MKAFTFFNIYTGETKEKSSNILSLYERNHLELLNDENLEFCLELQRIVLLDKCKDLSNNYCKEILQNILKKRIAYSKVFCPIHYTKSLILDNVFVCVKCLKRKKRKAFYSHKFSIDLKASSLERFDETLNKDKRKKIDHLKKQIAQLERIAAALEKKTLK